MINHLIERAAADRHDPSKYGYFCKVCGTHASSYNCNASLIAERPEAEEWDWWIACDNADCCNAYGEGFFQGKPDWIGKNSPVAVPTGIGK